MNPLRLIDANKVTLAEIQIGTGSDAFARRVTTDFVRAVLTAPEGSEVAVQTRRGWERRYIVQRRGQYFTRTAPPKPSEVPTMPVGRGHRRGKATGPLPVLPPRAATPVEVTHDDAVTVLSLIAEEVEPAPLPPPVLRLVRDEEVAGDAGSRCWALEAVQEGVFSDDDAIRLAPLENTPKNRWVLGLLRRELVTVAQALRLVK